MSWLWDAGSMVRCLYWSIAPVAVGHLFCRCCGCCGWSVSSRILFVRHNSALVILGFVLSALLIRAMSIHDCPLTYFATGSCAALLELLIHRTRSYPWFGVNSIRLLATAAPQTTHSPIRSDYTLHSERTNQGYAYYYLCFELWLCLT